MHLQWQRHSSGADWTRTPVHGQRSWHNSALTTQAPVARCKNTNMSKATCVTSGDQVKGRLTIQPLPCTVFRCWQTRQTVRHRLNCTVNRLATETKALAKTTVASEVFDLHETTHYKTYKFPQRLPSVSLVHVLLIQRSNIDYDIILWFVLNDLIPLAAPARTAGETAQWRNMQM